MKGQCFFISTEQITATDMTWITVNKFPSTFPDYEELTN